MNRLQAAFLLASSVTGAAPAIPSAPPLVPADEMACILVHYTGRPVTHRWAQEVGDACHADPLDAAVVVAQQLDALAQARGQATVTFALLNDQCKSDLAECQTQGF